MTAKIESLYKGGGEVKSCSNLMKMRMKPCQNVRECVVCIMEFAKSIDKRLRNILVKFHSCLNEAIVSKHD